MKCLRDLYEIATLDSDGGAGGGSDPGDANSDAGPGGVGTGQGGASAGAAGAGSASAGGAGAGDATGGLSGVGSLSSLSEGMSNVADSPTTGSLASFGVEGVTSMGPSMGLGPNVSEVMGAPAPATPTSFFDKSLGVPNPSITNALNALQGKPTESLTVGKGVLGALSMGVPGFGLVSLVGNSLNALGAEPSTDSTPGSPAGEPDGGSGYDGSNLFVASTDQPTPAPAPAPAPFTLGAPPDALNLSSAMSPLQMRSAIATGGVAGNSGLYTSDIARKYYADLLRAEQPDINDLLPVERQYASRLGVSNYPNTQRLLEAIAGA